MKIVREILESEQGVNKIVKGDFITSFKKIGEYKSVSKTLNIKPDFVMEMNGGGINYVFVCNTIFDCYKIMSQLVLFKSLKMPLDCMKLIFFIKRDEALYNSKEIGTTTDSYSYKTSDVWKNINEVAKWFEEKIEKEIILKKLQ